MEEDLANLLNPHENLLQMFFHLLWQKGNGTGSTTAGTPGGAGISHVLQGVHIPPTLILNHSRPLQWYFTAKDGTIKMKNRQKLSSQNVVAEFTGKQPTTGDGEAAGSSAGGGGGSGVKEHLATSSVAHKQRHNLSDVTAILVDTDSTIEEGVTHRSIPKSMFAQALSGTDELLSGTLQSFIEPKGNGGGNSVNNHMIVVNWTPNVMHCERRSNRLNMVDSVGNRHSLEDRTTLSESSVYVSTTPIVSAHLIHQLEQLSTRIATHIGEVHHGCRVNNMVLHCKMDAHDQIWLMYCSTLRAVKLNSHRPEGVPQELGLTLVPPRHQSKKNNVSSATVSAHHQQASGEPSTRKQQILMRDELSDSNSTPVPRTGGGTNSSRAGNHHQAVGGTYGIDGSFGLSKSKSKLKAARDLAKAQQLNRQQRYTTAQDDQQLHLLGCRPEQTGGAEVYGNNDETVVLEEDMGSSSSSGSYFTSTDHPEDDGESYRGESGSFVVAGNYSSHDSSHALTKGQGQHQEEQLDVTPRRKDTAEEVEEESNDDDLGDCTLCLRVLGGDWDATPVQQKHVFFPLQVVAFFNANKPGTVFTESDGLKQGVVPGHIQLVQPQLTFQEYSEIMQGRYPGAPKNANSRVGGGVSGKKWFEDQYLVICQSCAAGLQSMTAGIPIDSDGFIRVPLENGSSSLKPSRRSRQVSQQRQQQAEERAATASVTPGRGSGVLRMVPSESLKSNLRVGSGGRNSRSSSRNNTPATQPATTARPSTRSKIVVYHSSGGGGDENKMPEEGKTKHLHHLHPHTRRSPSFSSEGGGGSELNSTSATRHQHPSSASGKGANNSIATTVGRPPLAHRSTRPASSFQ